MHKTHYGLAFSLSLVCVVKNDGAINAAPPKSKRISIHESHGKISQHKHTSRNMNYGHSFSVLINILNEQSPKLHSGVNTTEEWGCANMESKCKQQKFIWLNLNNTHTHTHTQVAYSPKWQNRKAMPKIKVCVHLIYDFANNYIFIIIIIIFSTSNIQHPNASILCWGLNQSTFSQNPIE